MSKIKLLASLGMLLYGGTVFSSSNVTADTLEDNETALIQEYNISNILTTQIVGNDTIVTLEEGFEITLHDYTGSVEELVVNVSENVIPGLSTYAAYGFADTMTVETTVSSSKVSRYLKNVI